MKSRPAAKKGITEMSKKSLDRTDRLEQQYRRLGKRDPSCLGCGESNPFCLELHHVAGQKHHDAVGIVCRNCHRKLTDQQHDHTPSATEFRGQDAAIGHYLLGLADFLLMVVNALRKFGKKHIGESHVAK
jgi:hypothetical protein